MAREPRHIQNAFNAGELSPRLHSRFDLEKYKHGCKTLENFIPLVYGGAMRRPGTRFVWPVKFHSTTAVTHSKTPTANEVGQGGGWTNPGNVTAEDAIYATAAPGAGARISTLFKTFVFNIPAANVIREIRVRCKYKVGSAAQDSRLEVQLHFGGAAVLPKRTDSSEPLSDTEVKFDFTLGRPWTPADLDNAGFKVEVTAFQNGGAAITFSLDLLMVDVVSSPTTNEILAPVRLIPFEFSTTQAYSLLFGHQYMRVFRNGGYVEVLSGTGQPFELATPYSSEPINKVFELPDLRYAQSADVLYLAHGSHAPRKIQRTADNAWTITIIPFVDGPYRDENTDTVKTLALTGGPPWTKGSSLTLTAAGAGNTPFLAAHVNSIWRLKSGTDTVWVTVTAFTSSTVVTVRAEKDVPASLQTTATSLWREGAWSTVRGFPATVTFFEDRLYFGGPTAEPHRFDGSGIHTYEDFTPGTADDDAVSFSVTSGKVNVMRWMLGARDLMIGTVGEEFSEKGASGKTITPTSIQSESETTHGSAAIAPVRIGNSVLFVQRAGKKLRELLFNFDIDGYLSVDATLLAQHLTKTSAILELAYQQEPNSILWAIRADGQLLALVYDKTQDVAGWARHITDGKFKSIAAIPHPNGDRDQLWAIVERTINGATWRYVEYLDDTGGSFAAYEQLAVDSGLTYSGAATATLSGLAHLEGETVDIVGNGFVYPQKVVSGGQVTGLDPTVTSAEVGLPFTSKLEPLPPVPQAAPDAPKRRARLFVQLHDSLGLKINGQQLDFRKASDPMDLPVPIFTGAKEVVSLGWDKEGIVKIEQAQPLPCTVLSVHGHFDAGD